jgi:hypothetical protein
MEDRSPISIVSPLNLFPTKKI